MGQNIKIYCDIILRNKKYIHFIFILIFIVQVEVLTSEKLGFSVGDSVLVSSKQAHSLIIFYNYN